MAKNKKEQLWLQFDVQIKGEQKELFQPLKVEIESIEMTPHYDLKYKPLKYHSDALVGVSTLKLLEEKSSWSNSWYDSISNLWKNLDPNYAMYFKCYDRIHSLFKDHKTPISSSNVGKLDKSVHEIINDSVHPWGIDLESLFYLVDSIYYFEGQQNSPLLYNCQMELPPDTREKLLAVHSLLINLRALSATDYNSFINDATHEAIKVDTVTDYISKAEYIANDAALFCKFEKLAHQMRSSKIYDSFFKEFYVPMHKNFAKYGHNSYWLIQNLPTEVIDKLPSHQIDDFLYLVQMDWILGSDAGLLYKIREELFGIKDGYTKTFWDDHHITQNRKPISNLSLSCQLASGEDNYKDTKKSA